MKHPTRFSSGGALATCLFCLLLLSSARAATRPVAPVSFDAPAVQKLIDGIDQSPNATILRTGYFMRREAQPLAAEDGFALLQKAAQQAPVDSKRWFVLQNTLAFAAFHLPAPKSAEGFAAYDTLFAHAPKAGDANALPALRQGISDYLLAVQGQLGDLKPQNERLTKTLGQAWVAYLSVLAQEAKTKPKYATSEPMWALAVKAANLPEGFGAIVGKSLADPAQPKTFTFYKAATSALAGSNPSRAVELLRQARPLLPQDSSTETAWYFSKLVGILEQQAVINDKGQSQPLDKAKLYEAIAVQQDRIKTTGRGHVHLAELSLMNGDEAALDTLVAQLSAADAPEDEIFEAGMLLARTNRNLKKAGTPDVKIVKLQTDLMNSYLRAARPRSEVNARRARSLLNRTQKK